MRANDFDEKLEGSIQEKNEESLTDEWVGLGKNYSKNRKPCSFLVPFN